MMLKRAIHLVLHLGDWATGGHFMQQLSFARKITKGAPEFLKRHQLSQIKVLLRFVSSQIPFYKDSLNDKALNDFQNIECLPLMDKVLVQNNLNELINPNEKQKTYKLLTSGSSGTRGFVFVNKRELSTNRALQMLWWEWAGYSIGDRVLQLGFDKQRSLTKRIKDFLLRTDYYFAKELTEEKILKTLRRYQSKQSVVFFGYAAYLNWFAEVALKHQISNVHFKTIISCGDKLFPHYRENILRAFGNQVFDTYGASEGFLLAAQRSCGKMHTYPQHLLIEILDDYGKPVSTGTLGHVYVTCLTTFTMPLIRYKLGDMAAIGDFETCSCGISTPVISQLIGRDTDVIKGLNGGVFTVQDLVYALKNVSNLEGYQLLWQESFEFTLEYWPARVALNDMRLLKEFLEEKLQTEIKITYKPVQAPRIFGGKVQLIQKIS
jgi:phenylacetate-CoA ligase